MQMSQRGKVIAIIVLFAVVLLSLGIRSSMMASARQVAAKAAQDVVEKQSAYKDISTKLEKAKTKHRPEYLAGVSLIGSKASLEEADELIKKAKKANHPDLVRRYANQAQADSAQAGGALDETMGRINFLDSALEKYKTEPEKVEKMILAYKAVASKLRKEGYFEQNFTDAEILIEAAQSRLVLANQLATNVMPDGWLDYVASYRASLDGEKFASDAKSFAEAIPKQRRENEERLAKYPETYNRARHAYEPAWFAAKNLEAYPAYRCLDSVLAARASMLQTEKMLQETKAMNSMQTQNFKGAARILSQAESILAETVATYEKAADSWRDLEEAIRSCGEARSEAKDAIDRAQSYADEWRGRNSQSTADALITQARSEMSSGDLQKKANPPYALKQFEDAKIHADEAYNAVDTYTHTTSSSSSSTSDDDSGGIFGGSSSTSSPSDLGGSSGSSWGSGGGDSSFGGGFDSGPSGGGYDSGPSGGGVGNGDF